MKNKNNTNVKVTYNSITFLGLLTALFIALKLIGVISWSWLWVLSPIWIPTILAIVAIAILAVVFVNKK